jgi:hypothetical protein
MNKSAKNDPRNVLFDPNQAPIHIELQNGARSGQVSRVITAFDAKVARRALALSVVAFACAHALTAATDEGGVPWMERIARTMPALPIACGVGAWLAMAPLRARGDERALAAIGRSPWEIARPAVFASVLLHAIAALVLAASPTKLLQTFFPRPPAAQSIVWEGHDFLDTARGIVIHVDGSMDKVAATTALEPNNPSFARLAVGLVLLFAGAALPMWALLVRRKQAATVGLAGAATAGATILCFHAAAVGQLPAITAALPSGALLAGAALRYRSER